MTTLIPKFDLKNGGSTPSGAINRSIYQKLSDTVSVLDFGADPTGATDSTTAIQSAIDYCQTNKRTLLLNGGTYQTTGTGYYGIDFNGITISLSSWSVYRASTSSTMLYAAATGGTSGAGGQVFTSNALSFLGLSAEL